MEREREILLVKIMWVPTFLSHYRHIQVVDQSQLQSLRPLVEVRVIKGLNVKQHREPVVFTGLGTLEETEEMPNEIMFCHLTFGTFMNQ